MSVANSLVKKIFISYNHSFSALVENLQTRLQKELDIEVVRDIQVDLGGDFNQFMKKIRQCSFIIAVINDDYLQSANCMFEVHEMMKDDDYHEKLLAIVIKGTEFYQAKDISRYVRYWHERKQELELDSKDIPEESKTHILYELKLINHILLDIDVFLDKLRKVRHVVVGKDVTTIPEDILKEIISKIRASREIDGVQPKTIELTPFARIAKKDIVGREKDLENLRNTLLTEKKIALINGMGGIGKTTLASVYLNEFYDKYSHIAWLTIENTLEEAIITNTWLIKNLGLEHEKPETIADMCLLRFHSITGSKPGLLILDNANERLSNYYDRLPGAPGWHVLVTSREKISPFHIIDLDFLEEKEAVELFLSHCKRFSKDQTEEIVRQVERHTLTIEILAKSAEKNHWDIDTAKKAIHIDARSGSETGHSKHAKIERVKTYLSGIFTLSNINENETWLLKQFTALPNNWIPSDFLHSLLKADELEWKDEFFISLENLHEKGYLQKDSQTDSFKMHPVFQEALSQKLKPTTTDLEILIKSVNELLHLDQEKDNPIEKLQFITLGKSLLNLFYEDMSLNISELQNNLALRFNDLGKYEEAKNLLEKCLRGRIETLGELHHLVAQTYNNLGNIYKDLGEDVKAKDSLEKALQSTLAIFGEMDPGINIIRSNLGSIYRGLGERNKALDTFETALKSAANQYDIDSIHIAIIQSSLALVYEDMGEYEKAKNLLEKAIQIGKTRFGKNNPTVNIFKSNLASVLRHFNDYEKARDLLEEILHSEIKNFGEKHPNIARYKSNLAIIYEKTGNINKAIDLCQSAYVIACESLGNNHPNTRSVKKYLDHLLGRNR
jgi:tetratricopeptide (TPR) repeat protein